MNPPALADIRIGVIGLGHVACRSQCILHGIFPCSA